MILCAEMYGQMHVVRSLTGDTNRVETLCGFTQYMVDILQLPVRAVECETCGDELAEIHVPRISIGRTVSPDEITRDVQEMFRSMSGRMAQTPPRPFLSQITREPVGRVSEMRQLGPRSSERRPRMCSECMADPCACDRCTCPPWYWNGVNNRDGQTHHMSCTQGAEIDVDIDDDSVIRFSLLELD